MGGPIAIGLCFGLADVDSTFEESAIFNADAGSGDVSGECSFGTNIDAVGGGDVPTNLAEHDDFASNDACGDLAIATHGYAIAGEIDAALDLAVNK